MRANARLAGSIHKNGMKSPKPKDIKSSGKSSKCSHTPSKPKK